MAHPWVLTCEFLLYHDQLEMLSACDADALEQLLRQDISFAFQFKLRQCFAVLKHHDLGILSEEARLVLTEFLVFEKLDVPPPFEVNWEDYKRVVAKMGEKFTYLPQAEQQQLQADAADIIFLAMGSVPSPRLERLLDTGDTQSRPLGEILAATTPLNARLLADAGQQTKLADEIERACSPCFPEAVPSQIVASPDLGLALSLLQNRAVPSVEQAVQVGVRVFTTVTQTDPPSKSDDDSALEREPSPAPSASTLTEIPATPSQPPSPAQPASSVPSSSPPQRKRKRDDTGSEVGDSPPQEAAGRRHYRGSQRRRFTPGEDKALKSGVVKFGSQWREIAKMPIFRNKRTNVQLKDRWRILQMQPQSSS